MKRIELQWRDGHKTQVDVVSWEFGHGVLTLEYKTMWVHYPLDQFYAVAIPYKNI